MPTELFNIFKGQLAEKITELGNLDQKVRAGTAGQQELGKAGQDLSMLARTVHNAGFTDQDNFPYENVVPQNGTQFNNQKWSGRLSTAALDLQNNMKG